MTKSAINALVGILGVRDHPGTHRVEQLYLLIYQPFMVSRSSTLMVFRLRNSTTRMASPIADSAAATVRIKNTNTWPAISPEKWEKAIKFMFTASSMSSMHMSRMITFLRLINIPATLRQNRRVFGNYRGTPTTSCVFINVRRLHNLSG